MQRYEPVMSTRPKRPRLRVLSKMLGRWFLEIWGISHTRIGDAFSSATLEKLGPLMRQGSQ